LKLIKDGEISTLGGSKYLLVELPMSGEFPSYEDIILELIRDGYKVILAHPERYNSFQKDFSLIQELFDMGVIFQCNLGSFAGQYGGTVKKLAVKLAKADMIFALASDIHHPKGIKFWNKALKKVSKYYDEIELDEILITNPRKILTQ
jgi:protein-tyrosine phosphatase